MVFACKLRSNSPKDRLPESERGRAFRVFGKLLLRLNVCDFRRVPREAGYHAYRVPTGRLEHTHTTHNLYYVMH